MNTNTNATKTEAETTEATYCPAAYATLLNKGLERVVEMSKTSFDLAAEQNTEVLASCKKALKALSMPGLFLFDLAGQAFEGYVTLQKSLLDLAVEQSSAAADVVQGRADGPGPFIGGDMSDKTHTEWCLSNSVDPNTSESYVCNCGADSASLDEIQRAIAWLGENTRLREASTAELLAVYTTEKNAEITRLREVSQRNSV
jgi:hypothetical protein